MRILCGIFVEGKGFWAEVEDGYFIPEILESLKGMKVGVDTSAR